MCAHEHIAMMMSGKMEEKAAVKSSEENEDDNESAIVDDKKWLENSAKYLFNHFRVDFSDSNVRRLEEEVMRKNKSGDWSKVYQVC